MWPGKSREEGSFNLVGSSFLPLLCCLFLSSLLRDGSAPRPVTFTYQKHFRKDSGPQKLEMLEDPEVTGRLGLLSLGPPRSLHGNVRW